MEKIKVGQVWVVKTDNFKTSGRSNEFKRPVLLGKNELIEIRYPFEWHFRTLDDHYWHSEAKDILENCEIFGNIWRNVRFSNHCSLSEIINLSLLDAIGENSYVWAQNFDRAFLERMKLKKLISDYCDKHKKKERK